MRVLKVIGIVILILSFVSALIIVGRVESEDRLYKHGEIEQEEMTGVEDLVFQIVICAGVAVFGGAIWAIGAYVEADRTEKRYRRLYR